LSAVRQDSLSDYVARSVAVLCLSVPSFWMALLVIKFGFDWFSWTPPIRYADPWDDPAANIGILWAPALILGFSLAGTTMRLTRSTMLETLRQDYIRTARAKGLRERVLITRHALRNALLPV